LNGCEISTSNVVKFPRTFKIQNSIEALGIVATKIDYSGFSSSNTVHNVTLQEENILFVVPDYGTGFLRVSDNTNNHSLITITLLKIESDNALIGEYSPYIIGFSIFGGEVYYSNIDKAVDKSLFNGSWTGVFENGYLTENIIFQDGEFTVLRNNYNFYKGIYYATERRLYLIRNKMWDGESWIDMAESDIGEIYVLEENKLILKRSSSTNTKEDIYIKTGD
jgi:hypothetical protein